MQEFTIKPDEGYKDLKKKILNRIFFMAGIVILVLFVAPTVVSGKIQMPDTSLWLTLLLITAVMTMTLSNILKKQKTTLLSYKLTITEDTITREMVNTPTIILPKNEVKDIVKDANGAFAIVGTSKINAIGVPASIFRRDELELLLAEIKPLTIKTSENWIQKYQLLIALLIISLMFITVSVENKLIATISGIAFLGSMVYSLIITQISKNIDMRTKRISWMIIIPIASMLYFVISKWLA